MKTAKYICERCTRSGDLRDYYCDTCVCGSHFIERRKPLTKTPINHSFDGVKDTDVSRETAMLLRHMYNTNYTNYGYYGMNRRNVEIKNVIFNDPATIVFWSDGQKTVVKAQNGDEFDPEKGLAMAISKRVLGNQGNYYEEFKKWLPEYKELNDEDESVSITINIPKVTPEILKQAFNLPDDVFATFFSKTSDDEDD